MEGTAITWCTRGGLKAGRVEFLRDVAEGAHRPAAALKADEGVRFNG